MSITSITIAGSAVNLNMVEYNVAIYHGRNDVTTQPQPSNAQIKLICTGQYSVPVALGDTVVIQAYSVNRFTGRVTDLIVDHATISGTQTPYTAVTITAMGNLARLGNYWTGDAGYAAENLDVRATSILAATPLTSTVEAEPDVALTAYTGGLASVYDLLTQLCEWTGATMYDKPDGSVYFESYTRRGYTYSDAKWSELTGAWSSYTGTWNDQNNPSTTAPTPVTLPSSSVVWEPRWTATTTTVLNDVTISYGSSDPQSTLQLTDAASITTFGKRAVELTTQLDTLDDATRRAQLVLTSQGGQRWQLGTVEIIVEQLTTTQRTAVLALTSGDRVLVTDLPQPAPYYQFIGVVEGWGETYTPGSHRLSLSLSDPRYSYAVVTWGEAPATADWANVPAGNDWSEIILPADLAA